MFIASIIASKASNLNEFGNKEVMLNEIEIANRLHSYFRDQADRIEVKIILNRLLKDDYNVVRAWEIGLTGSTVKNFYYKTNEDTIFPLTNLRDIVNLLKSNYLNKETYIEYLSFLLKYTDNSGELVFKEKLQELDPFVFNSDNELYNKLKTNIKSPKISFVGNGDFVIDFFYYDNGLLSIAQLKRTEGLLIIQTIDEWLLAEPIIIQ